VSMGDARQRWLDEGVDVLSEEGASGVRIDRIAARLGLSKGSFHHHFDGAGGFKLELLAHLEELLTGALQRTVADGEAQESGRDTFVRLIPLVVAGHGGVYRPQLEKALRAWALTDDDAARTQANIDEARLEAIRGIWHKLSDDEEDVRVAALLPYVIAIGSTVIFPPLSTDDLQLLYERILPLVPDGDAPVDDGTGGLPCG